MIGERAGERPGERTVARLRGVAEGPTLIAIGAVHGNEPAGVDAIRDVLGGLGARGVAVRGEVIGLVGNVRALAARRRYLARDLNRLWTPARMAAARAAAAAAVADPWSTPTTDGAELAELAELDDELERVLAAARGPVYVVDLHTTSAPGIPFAVIGHRGAQCDFAMRFPLPGILGLEDRLEGVLTRYLATKGCVTLAIEGGQHEARETAGHLHAVLTVALAASGCVAAADLPDLPAARADLARARGALPHLIEVVSRHEVRPDDDFQMVPGFANIHHTAAGTLLARDRGGEIRAPFDGVVLLPLYQQQGTDGFFYGRAVPAPD